MTYQEALAVLEIRQSANKATANVLATIRLAARERAAESAGGHVPLRFQVAAQVIANGVQA